MRYSKLLSCDTNNGSGFRVTLFVSGCTINCYNCQNKLAQNFNFGFRYTDETKEKILKLMSKPYIKGFSLLGGEPFDNLKDGQLLDLLKEIKKLYPKKTVFCWSGYTFEEILKDDLKKSILPYIDMIRDGRYIEEEKDLNQYLQGSKNQRYVDVKESLLKNKYIEYNFKKDDI